MRVYIPFLFCVTTLQKCWKESCLCTFLVKRRKNFGPPFIGLHRKLTSSKNELFQQNLFRQICAVSRILIKHYNIFINILNCLKITQNLAHKWGGFLLKGVEYSFLLSKDATLRALLVLYENIDITTDCYFLRWPICEKSYKKTAIFITCLHRWE